jgi:hypothetical protein
MIFLLAYVAVFFPAVYATARLRALRGRGQRAGRYRRNMLLLFGALFLAGFLAAPAAALALLVLLAVAVWHTAREVAYRHLTVQYGRGNRTDRPVPPGRRSGL